MLWVDSVTPPSALSQGKDPGTHWIVGVGLTAGLNTEVRGKILCLCRGSNSGRLVCSQTLYWLSYPSTIYYRSWLRLICRPNYFFYIAQSHFKSCISFGGIGRLYSHHRILVYGSVQNTALNNEVIGQLQPFCTPTCTEDVTCVPLL
jgi:hypothetical protein